MFINSIAPVFNFPCVVKLNHDFNSKPVHVFNIVQYPISYPLGIYNEEFTISHRNRVWILDNVVLFQYHKGPYIMQAPSCIGRVVPISIWFIMVLVQITMGIQIFCLDISTKYISRFWLVLQFWCPRVCLSLPLSLLILSIQLSTTMMRVSMFKLRSGYRSVCTWY